jgi:hypothetical protein
MVPSFVIETVATLLCCTAAIPFRRVPLEKTTWPAHDPRRKG